jgi:regulatory protein
VGRVHYFKKYSIDMRVADHVPTVTALEPQRSDPERLNVFLDGTFAFGISRYLALSYRLSVGVELESDAVERLSHADLADRSYHAALNFLSYRPRSRREVEIYLRRRSLEADMIVEVLERLERTGIVDDRAFAAFWVENRQMFRPRGSRAVRMELQQKGVDRDVAEDALSSLPDEETSARAAAMKKLRSYASLDDRTFFTRMVGHLQRRGFAYAVAAGVTRDLLATRGATLEDLPEVGTEED